MPAIYAVGRGQHARRSEADYPVREETDAIVLTHSLWMTILAGSADPRPLFTAWVGDRQVDVDDGLGRPPRDRGRAYVFKLQYPPAQGGPDPPGQVVVLPRPGGVGIGDLDADRRGGAGHPWIGFGGRGIDERHDLSSAGHQRSSWPAPQQMRMSDE
jgi:hypothetical protein